MQPADLQSASALAEWVAFRHQIVAWACLIQFRSNYARLHQSVSEQKAIRNHFSFERLAVHLKAPQHGTSDAYEFLSLE
jgi:hypothetical protein